MIGKPRDRPVHTAAGMRGRTGFVSDNASPYMKGVQEGIAPLYVAQIGGFNRL